MKTIHHLLATWFGLGHFPIASGTVGTAGAVVLVLALGWLLPADPTWLFLPVALGLAAIFFAAGIPAARWAEKQYGRKDPGQFVLDEVIGYLVGVAWVTAPGWEAAVIAFFVFRFADIAKVWPGNRFEALPHGWGIILDDVVAGVYTLAVMIPVRIWLFP